MLELYHAEGCPHCAKVRAKLAELGSSYVVHNPRTAGGDVRNEQTHDELVALGGKDQVPFLVDTHGQTSMYESNDIIEYLERRHGRARLAS